MCMTSRVDNGLLLPLIVSGQRSIYPFLLMLHSLLSSINMSYISFGEHYTSLYLQTRLRDSKQQSRCPFSPSMCLLFYILW